MASNRSELSALKNLLSQADRILETAPASTLRIARQPAANCCASALALADDLLKQSKLPAGCAILGRKGGSVIAKRGSEYFRKLAAKRKTHGGGRARAKNPSKLGSKTKSPARWLGHFDES